MPQTPDTESDPYPRSAEDFGTELPGSRATDRQLTLAVHRYAVVAAHSAGKRVLDVACGAGQGLPVIRRAADRLIAGDLTWSNLERARAVAGDVPLVRLDAQRLPFEDESFDVATILEGIYYLPDARRFVRESWRVLRPGGRLIVGAVNPRGRDFNRPPSRSTRTFDSAELRALLMAEGFRATVYGAFPSAIGSGPRWVSWLRAISSRAAFPWPTWARWAIRRLLHGQLTRYPASFERIPAASPPLEEVGDEVDRIHMALYAIGTKGEG